MKQDKEVLGRENVGKLLVKLAIPTVIAQIVNLLYNIVDRIYIGRYDPSGLLLTSLGVCLPILTLIMAFASLVGTGGAPKASLHMGKKEYGHAEKILGNSFSFLLVISVVLAVGLSLFARPLLYAVGASTTTIGPAVEYLRIYLCGTVFVLIVLGMNTFITAQGFSQASMMSVLIGAVCNIILDPLFIFGFDLGVKGAAIATVISQAVSAVWVLLFLTGKRSILQIKKQNLRIKWKVLLPCLGLGLSPFIMTSTESLLTICFNTSLRRYGGDLAVGAMTILTTMLQFSTLPLMGLAQGAQPITSYNYGAKKYDRVRKSFLLLLATSLSYSLLLGIIVTAMPGVFVRIFTTKEELIGYASWALRIYFAGTLFMGIQIACQQTFIALGNAKTSLFLAVLRKLILLIPFIYLFPLLFENKAFAVFFAEPAADCIAILTTAIVFYIQCRGILKKKEVPEEQTV